MSTLATLLEQSNKLSASQYVPNSNSNNFGASTSSNQASTSAGPSHAPTNSLPTLQLGFQELSNQSRRILTRANASNTRDDGTSAGGNAYYLLASGGVNAEELSRNIESMNENLKNAFEPLMPLSDLDIEGYLTHTHEQTIISAIEEGRRSTVDHFYEKLDSQMRSGWERKKEGLFEELGRHSGSSSNLSGTPSRRRNGAGGGFDRSPKQTSASSSTPNSLQMHAQMMRYDIVVRKLNEARKQGTEFGLIDRFSEASRGVGDSKQLQIVETWKLLASLVGEKDAVNEDFNKKIPKEGEYFRAHNLTEEADIESIELRKSLAKGAKSFLESQFQTYVLKTISANPTQAQLGGVPSVQNKIRGFLNVKFLKSGIWTGGVEIANNLPLWATLFYLLRSGHEKEALAFVAEQESHFTKLEKTFVAYFKAWIENGMRLPFNLKSRFITDYNQKIRYESTVDPYKFALYKLMGRIEISRKNVAGITGTTEDWIWFQLSLINEDLILEDGVGSTDERFGLKDLGKCLLKFGENHFDPKGNKPLLYFQVLLLCDEFERAISFLHGHAQYQVDAVHFAIALNYYGLLRSPPNVKITDVDLLTLHDGNPALNYSRLIFRYTRAFVMTDVKEAINYIYLILLNVEKDKREGAKKIEICHEYIRDAVMETRMYTDLLGDVRADGTKIPGMLELDLPLLHLTDSRSYLNDIVKAAAKRANSEKRFKEAILLFNIAEEYDSVISVLNFELGNSLSKPSTTNSSQFTSSMFVDGEGKGKESLGMAVGMEDIVGISKSILEHYDKMAGINSKVGRKNRESCLILLNLKLAFEMFDQGKLQSALASVESLNLIPLSSELVSIIKAAEDFKEFDENIIRNFDLILLNTMKIIFKLHSTLKESVYGDTSRQQKMTELRQKARSLMMFAGMLRFRLTSDTYASLTRLDVFIH